MRLHVNTKATQCISGNVLFQPLFKACFSVRAKAGLSLSVKGADPVLVTELLLQVSVDLLDVVQVVHCHTAVFSIHTHFRALELLCQGLHLHLQV